MNLFYFLVVGLIAGWLAGQAMKGGGYVLVDIVLGILGAFVGAVVLVWIARQIKKHSLPRAWEFAIMPSGARIC